ncbi:penicillin-binding transpeptidase domain-containing protein [Granulicella sibirica]|uniref:Cell division protein FtsI [Peptidoglycan synthetase] n=1 Tax=Granulicella sibirica TaxID=2479048 RepID=A0A4V1L6A8_9BACT|nr:penicillin-binding transpeptidase domain-containing protein [Granulicella sibirica]RXH58614.1 Cell division protein FtsI [Peptidoglycan synthetase] [Granulicella sibirica]
MQADSSWKRDAPRQAILFCLLFLCLPIYGQSLGFLAGTNASAILLDVQTGRTIATFGRTGIPSTPGSTLKPFLLLAALKEGIVTEHTTVECRGILTIDDRGHPRNLACTHPRTTTIFAAQAALAYSCNTYFARLAARMSPTQLTQSLSNFGIRTQPIDDPNQRILQALGLFSVKVSAEQLARAYALLAREFTSAHSNPANIVHQGLLDSVSFGMADNAAVPGLTLAGKTGTASDPGRPWTHGWFAGIVEDAPATVLVVYVPHGSGADAATLARTILAKRERKP